ncbi:hypothetical protein [Actinomadura sp. NPDC048394]|uniref:hypothetical protein n=1 Tax=Actinomadura sp. NPDC048394 TaxID=3158223 RepID=UPI0033DD92EF
MTETVPTGPGTNDAPADVAAMLARSGLPAGPYELAYLAAEYPYLKAGIDMLYAVDAAKDADPALRFRAGVPAAR